jgi:hypothetical protein
MRGGMVPAERPSGNWAGPNGIGTRRVSLALPSRSETFLVGGDPVLDAALEALCGARFG